MTVTTFFVGLGEAHVFSSVNNMPRLKGMDLIHKAIMFVPSLLPYRG